MDIVCYCRICVKEINKKYENITQKTIDDLSIYDFSQIIRVIENFSDSGKWGVTENGNVVFINEGLYQYMKIESYFQKHENNKNNKSYVFNFNKYNHIECNLKKNNSKYNKNIQNDQKKCSNNNKLRKTNDKIQLKYSNKKLEKQTHRRNKFLNKKIKKTFNFHEFFNEKYFDCNPIDDFNDDFDDFDTNNYFDDFDLYYEFHDGHLTVYQY
jgi:hypothetical protein